MRQKLFDSNQKARQQVLERLSTILTKRAEVVFAYVYGSFLEGFPFHDIDIGVFVSKVTDENFSDCSAALSQMLSSEMKVPVDVRILNFAPVSFLYHVFRGKLIYERDEEMRASIVERTVQRYLDLQPMILRGVKEAFGSR